jgi:alanine dehydrogenase
VLGCHYVHLRRGKQGEPRLLVVEHDGTERPFLDLLSEADIIVNGVFQDPDAPLMFVVAEEVSRLKRDCLIVDVSCDEGMGFSFAKPTTFDEPMFKVGTVDYYAVDHTPSYLWESASRSVSAALIVHLPTVLAGRESWLESETIRRAIVIDEGVILKRNILSFQKRNAPYPHEPLATETS